jgi:hypothetical protein
MGVCLADPSVPQRDAAPVATLLVQQQCAAEILQGGAGLPGGGEGPSAGGQRRCPHPTVAERARPLDRGRATRDRRVVMGAVGLPKSQSCEENRFQNVLATLRGEDAESRNPAGRLQWVVN